MIIKVRGSKETKNKKKKSNETGKIKGEITRDEE